MSHDPKVQIGIQTAIGITELKKQHKARETELVKENERLRQVVRGKDLEIARLRKLVKE